LKNACFEIAAAASDAADTGTSIYDNSTNNISSEKFGPTSINYGGGRSGSGKWGGGNSSSEISYPTATQYIKGLLRPQGIKRV
jgi:hypothetical protein